MTGFTSGKNQTFTISLENDNSLNIDSRVFIFAIMQLSFPKERRKLNNLPDKSQQIKQDKLRMGIWFGLTAGLVFSFVLWGLDAIGLARANAYLPWAKLVMGVIPAVGIFTLAGWLSAKYENGLLSFLFWLVGGFLVSFYACHLPFEGLTLFYKVFQPELAARIDYTFTSGLSAHAFVTLAICVVASGICGVFFGMLSENAAISANPVGVIVPLLIWSVLFVASATVIDLEIQQRLRDPITAVNALVEKRIDSLTNPVSRIQARKSHLFSLNPIVDLIEQPRKLLLASYDDTLIQTNVQVNFGGEWAECIIIADQSAEPPVQQVIYCREVE
jgi:hypothetical protein